MLGGALKMLAGQLAQTVCGLEILRRLEWEVECHPAGVVGLDFVFKTFLGKHWFRVNIDAEKDKPFIYSPIYPYPILKKLKVVESETVEEAAAWLLSDVCSFYLLLALRDFLTPVYGYAPFSVPPNCYGKGVEFYLVVDELAIVTTHIFRQPGLGLGTTIVQAPKSLNPEGFHASVTFNKGSETVLELNDTYPVVVRTLERALALRSL
jgi:hypothetical protein